MCILRPTKVQTKELNACMTILERNVNDFSPYYPQMTQKVVIGFNYEL